MSVRTAETDDLDRIEALLDADDLPYRDVRTKPERFFVADADTEFVATGGIERYGLLRSIVVEGARPRDGAV